MIEYLNGQLVHKSPTHVVIDIGGIGYLAHISLHTYEKIANEGKTRLLTHPVIKEDSHQLYGFHDESERELFRQLIGISGVGPNTARMMLSSLPPKELKHAIIRGDVSLIKSVKGIGPKGAQRIIVELQDVLKKTEVEEVMVAGAQSRVVEEALLALGALGIQRPIAEKAIARVQREQGSNLSVEEVIRQSLKII